MTCILLFNLVAAILSTWYYFAITISCRKVKDLQRYNILLLILNSLSLGNVLNRVINDFLPYQTPLLTVMTVSYYLIQLYGAIQAQRIHYRLCQ